MTKAELATHIAIQNDISATKANAILTTILNAYTVALATGGEVTLGDVCKIKTTTHKARMARNPRTGESISVPAKRTLKVSVSSVMLQALNT